MLYKGVLALRWLADLDARMFLSMNRLHTYMRLEKPMRFISSMGDGYLYVLMGIIFPLLAPQLGVAFLKAMLIAFLLELPIYWALKHSFKRRRPFRVVEALAPLLKPSDEFSFPSGHTTAAFMVAALTVVYFPGAALVIYPWAALVGLSRVMLKVHFISDVLAGMVLGTVLALLSLALISGYSGTPF